MRRHSRSVWMVLVTVVSALAVASGLTVSGQAPPQDGTKARSIILQEPPQAGEEKKPEEKKKEEEKPFDEVVKDMEKIEGLFTFYRKADEDKVLVEILPDQFDKDYIYSSKVEQGTGERGLYGTIMMDAYVFQWRQLGKRVQFVEKNLRFRAQPGSPAARAVEKSFTDSVVGSAKVLSKPHPERKSVLVDLAEIFLGSDLHGIGQYLNEVYRARYQMDKANSGFVLVKSFPHNSEIGTTVHFKAAEYGQTNSTAIPDPRSLSLRFRYSLVALPESDYRPRLADDRVGHFLEQYMDSSDDKSDSRYVRYVERWNLKKKNPQAALSEPVEPIVFWLENSIPEQYRDFFREGILVWNQAFEKVGIKNAIVVKQQPDDADWDPADIRYNTVRWFTGYDGSFAIGPSHTNPYTGQIIDADIGWHENIIRFERRRFEESIDPVQSLLALKAEPALPAWALGQRDPRYLCNYAAGVAESAGGGRAILASRPDWSSEKEKEYIRQLVVHVIAHEVGHTLGLRHNYRASTLNSLEQMLDPRQTRARGLTGSVMEYSPPFIAGRGEKQGDYYLTHPGTYDQWAIEYAYKEVPGAQTPEEELPELGKIAARVADPALAYATDEDAGFNPRALDPRNNHWDASADPLAYYSHEFKLIHELWGNMEGKLLEPGKSFLVLRRAFGYTWRPYFLGSHVAMKYIGGLYHNRDHVGDPNGRLPYVPVPAAEQRRALAFLAHEVWAPDTFQVPAELLNKLQFERFYDFNFSVYFAPRLDYPLHDLVLNAQGEVLGDLYHPIKLSRLLDSEMRFADPNDRFTLADMFVGVRNAIWSELESGSSINSFRRNLQRAHLNQLIHLVLGPDPGTPEDAVTLARGDLVELGGRIDRALERSSLDYTSRAHLDETRARIRQALEAQAQRAF